MFVHPDIKQEFETLLRETDASPVEIKALLHRRHERLTSKILAWLANMDQWQGWNACRYPPCDSNEYRHYIQQPGLWKGPIWVDKELK